MRQTPRALRAADWLDSGPLVAAYELAWSLQIGARLVSDKPLDPDTLGAGGCAFLLRLTGHETLDALREELDTRTARAAGIIRAVLPEGEET